MVFILFLLWCLYLAKKLNDIYKRFEHFFFFLNGSTRRAKLTKEECQTVYHSGTDGEKFFALQSLMGTRDKTEKLLSLCNYNFIAAEKLANLCHFNIAVIERLVSYFDGGFLKAISYAEGFKEKQHSCSQTTFCSRVLDSIYSQKNDLHQNRFIGESTGKNGKEVSYFNIKRKEQPWLKKDQQELLNFARQFNDTKKSS